MKVVLTEKPSVARDIAAVLGAMQLAKQFRIPDMVECRLRTVTAYGVGVVAAFWFVERLVGFWA